MSKSPSTTTSTTYKLHAPNYVSPLNISSDNNETSEKLHMINSPSSTDIPHKTPKSIKVLASTHSINNNNKGIKQENSGNFKQHDKKFFTRLWGFLRNLIFYIYKTLSRIIELMTYFRLILALTLYSLIVVDVIHIYEKKEKRYWIEVLTQAINAEFTLLTIVGYPKRIRNLPRAIKIWWADRRGELPTINSYSSRYTSEIQNTQIRVSKDYKWYVYDTLDYSLNCTPIKLLSILLIWNIGSLSQYGISGILWFIPQTKRPVIPYIILTIMASISELVPIPAVVIQSKRARMANNFEIRYSFKYSIRDAC